MKIKLRARKIMHYGWGRWQTDRDYWYVLELVPQSCGRPLGHVRKMPNGDWGAFTSSETMVAKTARRKDAVAILVALDGKGK